MADRTSERVSSSTDLLCTYSVSEQDFSRRFLATIWTLTFDYKSLTVLKEGDKKNKLKSALFERLPNFFVLSLQVMFFETCFPSCLVSNHPR